MGAASDSRSPLVDKKSPAEAGLSALAMQLDILGAIAPI